MRWPISVSARIYKVYSYNTEIQVDKSKHLQEIWYCGSPQEKNQELEINNIYTNRILKNLRDGDYTKGMS